MVPDLPKTYRVGRGHRQYLPSTRDAWEAWWGSPMASLWEPSDFHVVLRLARLVDEAGRGEATAAQLSETRQLEDRLGLSAGAREKLRWEIKDDGEEAGGSGSPTVTKLSVVSDGRGA